MRQSTFVLLAAILGFTSAIPLNINLGAYSPALVVGDGEISLGAKESVSQIMGALQGAAVTAGTTNGAAGAGGATTTPKAAGAAEGAVAANAIAPGTTQAQTSNLVPSLATGAGLGNDLEPRIRPRVLQADASSSVAKRDMDTRIHARDLAGFDRALNFATTALTTGPRVELATENAGVGMIIEAGVNNGGPKAGATGGKAAKRDTEEKRSPKVTTVFVREIVDDVEGANLDKRDMETSISLDVSKARTLAMTFIEDE